MSSCSKALPDFTSYTLNGLNSKSFSIYLEEKIGAGAYGAVYRAVDLNRPDSQYAVKCVLKRRMDLLDKEILHHYTVSGHPGVVALHDVIEDDKYCFFVMDYCTGGDLFSLITEKKIFPDDTAAIKRTFIQLIDAVDGCHRLGVFHRDLKPENILLSGDGSQIFLADFGLSTMAKITSEFGAGTNNYMAPGMC